MTLRSPHPRPVARRVGAVSAAALAFLFAGCAAGTPSATTPGATPTATETGPGPTTTPSPGAGTPLLDAQGRTVGAVATEQTDQGLAFRITATGMEPGFHGLHLHQIGKCEPNSPDPSDPSKTGAFLSSGGHLGDGDHPNHSGDLPSLLVGQDGSGSLTVVSQRLTREQLADGDGTALVVHAGPDNYANIPTRYASAGPDDETKKAGDAGGRVACAVVGG